MKVELPDFDFKFVDMIAEGLDKADLEPRVGKPVATVPQVFFDNKHIGGFSDFAPFVKEKFVIKI